MGPVAEGTFIKFHCVFVRVPAPVNLLKLSVFTAGFKQRALKETSLKKRKIQKMCKYRAFCTFLMYKWATGPFFLSLYGFVAKQLLGSVTPVCCSE